MLVLSRDEGESLRIGDNIVITISQARDGKARIAIDAPREIKIHREEIWQRMQAQRLELPSVQ